MNNRTGNSNRPLDIPWPGILCVTLIAVMIGLGIWLTPSDAEQAKLQKIATQQAEQSRNAELKQTPGMEDCEFHLLQGMSVVRCPNSHTTTHYQCGKGCFQNNTVGDEK